MSLMQLLTVGRSLSGAKEGPNSFKMSEQNLLPKFTATKPQSSSASVCTSPETRPRETRDESLFDARFPASAEDPAKTEIETRSFPVPEPQPSPPPALIQTTQEQPAPRRTWSLKRALFLRRAPKTANNAAVQTEWALERVTVVRNDLSETDLEIVSARTGSRDKLKLEPFSASPGSGNGQTSMTRWWWLRNISRFFVPRPRV